MKKEVADYLRKITGVSGLDLTFPEKDGFGHFSTNVAFGLSKEEDRSPMETAKSLAGGIIEADSGKFFEKVEAAEPGFINFWLNEDAILGGLRRVLKEKDKYGRQKRQNKKIQVDFISANPVGPLTMANGRGGFFGDALSRVLSFAGYDVTREYLVNDAGNQIKTLGLSMLSALGFVPPADWHYKGSYVGEVAKKLSPQIKKITGNGKKPAADEVGKLAAKTFLADIKRSVKVADIKFDTWTSEAKDIRGKHLVSKLLTDLKSKNFTTEHDGAIWLNKEIAGKKERVLVKTGGEPTYYFVDLANHRSKLEKFDEIIDIWGSDHHGNVEPLKEGLKVLGLDAARLNVLLVQFVRLVKDGQAVKMSKRAGDYVTLDDLIADVGRDAVRFFFLMITPTTHMDFDLGLAKEKSMKNPVYYVQYAHVRCGGILGKVKSQKLKVKSNVLKNLNTKEDKKLILELTKFPDMILETANDYQVSRLAKYAVEIARAFHNFYEKERIAGEKNKDLAVARLELVRATQIVLGNLFDVLGISKPKKM